MKHLGWLLILIFFSETVYSQVAPAKYWIEFTDKNNSPYSISNPGAFLTQRAIARRAIQNIAVTAEDLPVNSWYVDSLLKKGATVLHTSRWFNAATISVPDSLTLQKILALNFVKSAMKVSRKSPAPGKIRKKGGDVLEMSENIVSNFTDFDKSNRAIFNGNTYNYGLAYTQVSMLGVDILHDLGYCGQGMMIAVLDAGFWGVDTMKVFDSLFAQNRLLGTRDFVNPGASVYHGSTHGMQVLSLMAANKPGLIVGTAPRASYWLLRSEDAASEYLVEECNWVAAAEFADSVGADIINSSLGYTLFDDSIYDHSYAMMDGNTTLVTRAADKACSKGIMVVNSAGNSGTSLWHYIGAPADGDSVLTVGAVDASRNYVAFSSKGPTYDNRIKPDLACMGHMAYVADTQGGASPGSGTSFSSPIMAGSVACLMQANPGKNPQQIVEALQKSADRFQNPDSLTGYGIPHFITAQMILSGIEIKTIDKEGQFTVNPNPFTQGFYLMFKTDNPDEIVIEMFDVNGKRVAGPEKIVKQAGFNCYYARNMQYLSKGTYFLRIKFGKNLYSQKVIKAE